MAEIKLENVSKRYGNVAALDDANLTIEDGSFTSVFGPPSSGKSVLLRVLLGLEPVDEGRILIDGKDVTNASPNERNLSMVFQNLALFPQLSAQENLVFPLRRRAAREEEINVRLDQVSSVLSIAHILHKKPASLSGGERQRVAIGRALIRDASAYMMDEPIAALDARLRDTMRVELKRLQTEQGRTFIYVTHDCEEAMSVADRMAILEAGRTVQVGKPDDVYAKPASLYVAKLVGSPGINVLEGQSDNGAIASAMGPITGQAGRRLTPGQKVRVALRPEALTLGNPDQSELNGDVCHVERLGSFSVITVNNGAGELRAIASGDASLKIGERVGVTVDPAGLHVFSADDGARIG